MTQLKKTTLLRRLIAGPDPVLLAGVQDGLSAALAERAGFTGLWASGFCISASMRLPDVGLISMAEHLAATREINNASSCPVVADVDDGYGDAINVDRMVREYEAAGIAAVCLEDNQHPKRNSLIEISSRRLVSRDDFTAKIRVAKAAQSDPDFMVIARTEAFVARLGLEEALDRANAYADAGADMVLVHSKGPTPEEVRTFSAHWKRDVPLVAVPTLYPDITAAELGSLGYRMIIFANQGMRAAVQSMDAIFRRMAETGTLSSVEGSVAPLKDIFSVVGYDDVYRLEAEYMGGAPRA